MELSKIIDQFKTNKKLRIEKEPHFIKVETYECLLNNGKTIQREKIVKGNNSSAVIIVPITKDNNVILVVEPRVFTKRTVGISVPAGYIENNENHKQAALRELKEEVGYTPNKLLYLGGFYQDQGCSDAYNEVFLALGCEKTSKQNLDKDEYISYFECSLEEAFKLIENNDIEDANGIIALNKAKIYLKER